jgi:hypothetical protein
MKGLFLAVLMLAADVAVAKEIPLPRPRPSDRSMTQAPAAQLDVGAVEITDARPPAPSACRLRLTPELAIAPSLPPTAGPGECSGSDLVRLEAVVLPDNKGKIALSPPAILRCSMAEAVVHWVREDVAPAAEELGSAAKALENLTSYQCRGRNGLPGAKLSQHGLANALDLRGVKLANGRTIDLTNPAASKDFRAGMRQSACARFTTVLGPGADSHHENHIHVDLAERRGGYRMCQWDVREPAVIAAPVPLPPPRPKVEDSAAREAAPGQVAALVPLPPPRPKIEDSAADGQSSRERRPSRWRWPELRFRR